MKKVLMAVLLLGSCVDLDALRRDATCALDDAGTCHLDAAAAGDQVLGDGDGDQVLGDGDGDQVLGDGDGDQVLGDGDQVIAGDGDGDADIDGGVTGDGDGDAIVVNVCGGVGGFACGCDAASCEYEAVCAIAELEVDPPKATVACPGPAAGGLVRYSYSIGAIFMPKSPEGFDVWTWQCAGSNLLICKGPEARFGRDGCTAARCPAGNCSGC